MTNLVLLSVALITNVQHSPTQTRGTNANSVGAYVTLHSVTRQYDWGWKKRGKLYHMPLLSEPVTNWYTTNEVKIQWFPERVAPQIAAKPPQLAGTNRARPLTPRERNLAK